jgi:hypothetical protein
MRNWRAVDLQVLLNLTFLLSENRSGPRIAAVTFFSFPFHKFYSTNELLLFFIC